MWGDILLIEFYPSNWQSGFCDTLHPWLSTIALWHYWYWMSFTILVMFYFAYVFNAFSYNSADISGRRSSGENSSVAWPEMLVCILPFMWCINVVSSAMSYMSLIEGGGGYPTISVHVVGFQWGWSYSYPDTFYYNMISLGYSLADGDGTTNVGHLHNLISYSPNPYVNEFEGAPISQSILSREMAMLRSLLRNPSLIHTPEFSDSDHCGWSWTINNINNQELLTELYYCSWWMNNIGVLEMDHSSLINNKLFQMGYWLSSQGLDPNNPSWMLTSDFNFKIENDYLSLLSATNSLILPSKSIISLLASSDDVTHSWAIPGVGLNVDCVPGSLFSVFTIIDSDGVYFGQCSELCGWNHYNMPITVHAIPFHHFLTWWELELHAMYNEPVNKYNSFLNFLKNMSVDYYYLNLKYK